MFEICGQPSVGRRRKRRADGRWPVVRGQPRDRDTPPTLPSIGVADVVHKIRVAVNETFGFRSRLSRDECSDFTMPSSAVDAVCWNGTNLVLYVSLFLVYNI